jgi:hypothetical protein
LPLQAIENMPITEICSLEHTRLPIIMIIIITAEAKPTNTHSIYNHKSNHTPATEAAYRNIHQQG